MDDVVGPSCISAKKKLMVVLIIIATLRFGKVWVWVLSGKTQPPIALEARRTVFEETNGDK
jgi:hypothetical protein